MKIIKEWVHEGLGKIICAEARAYKGRVVGPEEKSDSRIHYFGRKEKIKFLSKEPKLCNVMFSFFVTVALYPLITLINVFVQNKLMTDEV